MKNSYLKTAGPVKATYTIRYGGTTLRVHLTHRELLKLLCLLFRSREAA